MNKVLTALVFILSFTSCKTNDSDLTAIEKQTARNELCGVELYRKREDRLCGEIYLKKRSPSCGVSKYRSKKNKKCKGYVAPDTKYVDGDDCPRGYRSAHTATIYPRASREGHGNPRYRTRCERDEVIQKCRHKDNGVEFYKSCRDKTHGIERFVQCRRPEFGVQQYKQCEFYKTPEQALAYADLVEQDIPMMRDHLLIHKGNFFALQNYELGLACHIRAYENAPLAQDTISALKTKFEAVFAKPYAGDQYDCSVVADPIETAQCPEGDMSAPCRALFGYQSTLKWFEETKTDLGLIINDLANFGQKKVVDALTTVANYLKNPYTEEAAEAGAIQD